MTKPVHQDILPDAQRRLWPQLAGLTDRFVLYGGTAVALRLGHRQSVDFDFFCAEPLDIDALFTEHEFLADSDVLQREPDTLTVSVLKESPVKVSLFGGISFGRVWMPELTDDGCVRVASLLDLLGTKLKVLLQRIEIKDYLDIEAIVHAGVSLADGLGAARTLYGNAFPPMECVKALTYFEEGAARELPRDTRANLERIVADWNGEISDVSRLSGSLV